MGHIPPRLLQPYQLYPQAHTHSHACLNCTPRRTRTHMHASTVPTGSHTRACMPQLYSQAHSHTHACLNCTHRLTHTRKHASTVLPRTRTHTCMPQLYPQAHAHTHACLPPSPPCTELQRALGGGSSSSSNGSGSLASSGDALLQPATASALLQPGSGSAASKAVSEFNVHALSILLDVEIREALIGTAGIAAGKCLGGGGQGGDDRHSR